MFLCWVNIFHQESKSKKSGEARASSIRVAPDLCESAVPMLLAVFDISLNLELTKSSTHLLTIRQSLDSVNPWIRPRRTHLNGFVMPASQPPSTRLWNNCCLSISMRVCEWTILVSSMLSLIRFVAFMPELDVCFSKIPNKTRFSHLFSPALAKK